ncbi:hypothetical protein BD410DRAFT_899127 [Rickenella mellea]|uniref:Uncharacterized protein n=1 Tax=Rickenella mellea TaxID=50990 RepID=A0A4Y7Q175_9AGAM|nr:hypothetical protein BD410DRAFT_899127 [Rickenella mellea]
MRSGRWVGVGIWPSRSNSSKKKLRSRTRATRDVKGIRYEDIQARDFLEKDVHAPLEDEEVDAFDGQSHPFDEQEDLDPNQDQTLQRNENQFLEAPQPSREPTRTALFSSHTTPAPAPAKRPTMTPAPTIFSSTASSYNFDGEEEVYDSARLFTGEASILPPQARHVPRRRPRLPNLRVREDIPTRGGERLEDTGHERADSDVIIPLPLSTLPNTNEECRGVDTYTAFPTHAARHSTHSRSRSRSLRPVKPTRPSPAPLSPPLLSSLPLEPGNDLSPGCLFRLPCDA